MRNGRGAPSSGLYFVSWSPVVAYNATFGGRGRSFWDTAPGPVRRPVPCSESTESLVCPRQRSPSPSTVRGSGQANLRSPC